MGLVGDPVEDFLPLSPDIIAIEDSLPMALTALPVFWKIDTEVGLRQCPWFQWASSDQRGRAQAGRSGSWVQGLWSKPSLALLTLSACPKMFGEWNGSWN